MRLPRLKPLFPVLRKDLTEAASQKRTYVLRVLYALTLFAFFAFFFAEEAQRWSSNPGRMFGRGREFFEFTLAAQFFGVFLFLPAVMSGVFTREKERDSLGMLFLTDLTPREILFEKYLSGLVPMFTMLFLSLPLFAVTYSLGGVSDEQLMMGTVVLVLSCLQVGAIALMVSTFCRSSVNAFLGTYILGAAFYVTPVLVAFLGELYDHTSDFFRVLENVGENLAEALFPPALFFERRPGRISTLLVRSLPATISTIFFLVLARVFLIRRAFLPPRNALLRLWRKIDGFMDWLNDEYAKGIILVKDPDRLPLADPVAWRETTKKSLGKVRYLFRIFVLLEVPTLFITALVVIGARNHRRGQVEEISVLILILWGVALLALCAHSVNVIASERVSNTMDVLLTTPMTGWQIVREKLRATKRLLVMLVLPIVTLLLLELWWELGDRRNTLTPFWCFVASATALVVYLPLYNWLSLYLGLKIKHRLRAVVVALLTVVAWNVLPIFAYVWIRHTVGGRRVADMLSAGTFWGIVLCLCAFLACLPFHARRRRPVKATTKRWVGAILIALSGVALWNLGSAFIHGWTGRAYATEGVQLADVAYIAFLACLPLFYSRCRCVGPGKRMWLRGILVALAFVAAWHLGSIFIYAWGGDMRTAHNARFLDLAYIACHLACPLANVLTVEFAEPILAEIGRPRWSGNVQREVTMWLIAMNLLFHAVLLFWIRRRCLKNADSYLSRVPEPQTPRTWHSDFDYSLDGIRAAPPQ